MKKLLKLLSTLLAIVVVFSLIACNSSSDKPIVVLDSEQDLLDGNVVCFNSEVTSLQYLKRGGGRDGVFKWVLNSDADLSMDDVLITFADKYEGKIVEGKVISFDINLINPTRLAFRDGSKYHYLYNGPSDNQNVRFYSEFGGQMESGSIWGGALTNMWLTIQIKIQNDFAPGMPTLGITEWKYSNSFLLYNNNVYIDNIRILNDFGA